MVDIALNIEPNIDLQIDIDAAILGRVPDNVSSISSPISAPTPALPSVAGGNEVGVLVRGVWWVRLVYGWLGVDV